jgi:hypothetical protein
MILAMAVHGPHGRGKNCPAAKECDCAMNEWRGIVESTHTSFRKALSANTPYQGADRHATRD